MSPPRVTIPAKVAPNGVLLSNHTVTLSIVGALLLKLGGSAVITQADIDAVAGLGVAECWQDGQLGLEVVSPGGARQ